MPPPLPSQEQQGWRPVENREQEEWNKLHELQAQYPNLMKQRQERQQEISARAAELQLQATSGLLDAWGLGGSTEAPAPHASSSRGERPPYAPQSYHQQQPGGQHWLGDGWAYPHQALSSGAGIGGAFTASGLVGDSPLSPTEVPSSQALPFSSATSSYSSTYAPYYPPVGPPPSLNPPHPSFAPSNQHSHAVHQARDVYEPPATTDYARHDSYQAGPPVQPAPSPQTLALYPTYPPSHAYAVHPPPHQQLFPYPSPAPDGSADQYGRPQVAPAPQWSQIPQLSPQSFYGQHPHFQQQQYFPPQQPSPPYVTNYPPQEPAYEAYESTPSTDASYGTHEHSPQDARSSERSRQPSFAADSAPFPLLPTSAPPPSASAHLPIPSVVPVDFAAANRALLAQPVTAPKRARVTPVVGGGNPPSGQLQARASRKGSKRITADLMAACVNCGDPIARLILRGQPAELDVPHAAVFTCIQCDPSVSPPATNVNPSGSSTKPAKPSASFRKRHKRADTGAQAITACDVCLRDVATGSVVADDQQATIDFQIEIVCSRCDDRYRRCSDCGGGGGARLGVGKWRSKELFTNGRKTCSLSHLRLGALSDMFYDVHSVTEIPRNEMNEISDICQAIFSNTMFSGICIPEVFEQQSAVVKSFPEVKVWAARGWSAIEPMIKVDIERDRSVRRYLALRSCTPNPRKGSQPLDLPPADSSRVTLRANKDVVGFIVAEWDTLVGSLFLAVVVPWAMGEVFDATTILIQALFQRVEDDRRLLNAERAAGGLPEFPPVDIVWTMMFFEKEARMIAHLEKKRGFSHLGTFLQANPSVDPAYFPPLRPCYLPVERQQGWSVMVRRRQGSEDDDFFAIRRTSASEDVEKKKKEQKAKARREGEMGNHRG